MNNLFWSKLDWDNRPKYVQLYEYIRQGVLDGILLPNTKLPSSRALAEMIGLSRITVLQAYEHLIVEEYLETRRGDGTYINEHLKHRVVKDFAQEEGGISDRDFFSKRASILSDLPPMWSRVGHNLRPFRPGVPALWDFPYTNWLRILSQQAKNLVPDAYGYGDPAGYFPLRETIAAYLHISRGVKCKPEQIIMLSGTQQAFSLIAYILLDRGDQAWVEDPGYNGIKEALKISGIMPEPIPVDKEGISVSTGKSVAPTAKLAYVTPSNQYPTGIVMSLKRRLEILEWAKETGSWIIEDDYDSEYRYEGRPITALHGIDDSGRVLYIGTFSKVLFPALRLGYLVIPQDMIDLFTRAKSIMDRGESIIEQAALTVFMQNGHYERHIREMRNLYRERQQHVCYWSERLLSGVINIKPADTGLHLVGKLTEGDDRAIAQLMNKNGVFTPSISDYTLEYHHDPALIFGYAPYREAQIKKALQTMADTFENA
jgi:GntR family transcriptional regulator/MocR family aminotransferase